MPAYKEKEKKTWMSKFSYKDWQGKTRWVTKRGFDTKREALEYESNFKLQKAGSVEMTFGDFVNRYRLERYPRVKYSTQQTKDNIINNRILPYFKDKALNEISANDVIQWQNEMLNHKDKNGNPFSKSYLKTLHNQLSSLLNYAVRFYGLEKNVAAVVGNIGSDKDVEIDFWTREEYELFREEARRFSEYYYAFEVLYWTGIREGELLALTSEDIDFTNNTIRINKTYNRIKKFDYVTDPKTRKSNRIVKIPNFLAQELKEYMDMIYDLKKNDRLFLISKSSLGRYLKEIAGLACIKPIRVHDLRHSHVSLLINLNFSVVAIAERVGHESVEITYRYSHLFPSVQGEIANALDAIK